MKIENGKYYRTADGRKVGPMVGGPATYYTLDEGLFWADNGASAYENGPNLVAEWNEPSPLWRDMTPEQKGALLLAHHEGKVIETWMPNRWYICEPAWVYDCCYRVKPEPVVETRDIYLHSAPPIKIGTINLIDGTPDPATLNLETAND